MIDVTQIDPPLRREDFVKSTFSHEVPSGCLHVARRGGDVFLWEDGDPFDPALMLKVPNKSFVAFLKGAKAGEFDLSTKD